MHSTKKLRYYQPVYPRSLFAAIHENSELEVIKHGLQHDYTLFDEGTGYAWINLAVLRNREDVFNYISKNVLYTVHDMNAFLSTVTVTYNTSVSSEAVTACMKIARAVIAAWVKRMPIEVRQSFYQSLPFLHHVILACGEQVAIDAVLNGADIHMCTRSLVSALHLAVMCHYPRLALLLIEKNINISLKDYMGATALNHALSYVHMHAVADVLIARGGLNTANPAYAYNSFKQVNKLEHMSYLHWLKMMHPQVEPEWKEYYYSKLCAHVFEFNGRRVLQSKRPQLPFRHVWREGMTSPAGLLKKIAIATQEMDQRWPRHMSELATDLMYFTSKNADLSDADYFNRIKLGKPTLIATGCWSHAWYILFYRHFYILCNSNNIRVKFNRYDQDALTESMIHQLRLQFTYARSQSDINILLNQINEALNISIDPYHNEYAKHITIKEQKIGNCMYKSLELALSVFLVIENILNPRPYVTHIETTWMLAWISHLRLHFLENYLSLHKAQQMEYYPDYELLSEIRKYLRASSIDPQDKIRVEQAINRMNEISSCDLHFKAVMHEGTDTCFAQYTVLKSNIFAPAYQTMLQYRHAPELNDQKAYVPFKPV